MKNKLYLLFLLFSLFAFNSKGQISTSFPKDSAQWITRYSGYPGLDYLDPIYYFDTLYCYTMQGDTAIASVNYKKLRVFKLSSHLGVPSISSEVTIGALRYDSILNYVYYYSNSTGIEKPAYKFDLVAGNNFETSYTPFPYDSTITRVVDSTVIFTTYNGVQFTKNVRYLFHHECGWPNPMYPPAILNNIGSYYGFLQTYCPVEFNWHYLQCFSDLGNGDMHSFSSHDVLLSTGIKNDNDVVFNIYPTPANDFITLSIKGIPFSSSNKVSICNIMGELVSEKIINDPNTNIDIHFLKPGIYFIRLNTGNRIFVKKIIKQ